MARKHFHQHVNAGWQRWSELRRNPFIFAIALVSVSVILTVLLAAGSATASDAPSAPGVEVDRDHGVALIFALQAADPQVRLAAVQELAWRRTTEAADALINATYDADARVREEAIVALGEIGALQALPRLQELQIVQGNEHIQVAAADAERQLTGLVARGLQLPRSKVQAFTVGAAGQVYAAANDAFYVQRENSWERVGHLPDSPVALSVTADGKTIFAATNESGLYRSDNAGKTWVHVQFGVNTPTRLSVTALTLDPKNARHLYAALASMQVNGVEKTPLGVAESQDGGKTWVMLPDSPAWALTTRLVLDVTAPGYLFGEANGEAWRYALVGTSES